MEGRAVDNKLQELLAESEELRISKAAAEAKLHKFYDEVEGVLSNQARRKVMKSNLLEHYKTELAFTSDKQKVYEKIGVLNGMAQPLQRDLIDAGLLQYAIEKIVEDPPALSFKEEMGLVEPERVERFEYSIDEKNFSKIISVTINGVEYPKQV